MSHTLAVGQLYNPARTEYPVTEQVRIGRTICELVRYWPDPTPSEIRAHETGPATFALIAPSENLLMLAYRYSDLDWCDVPFQAHRLTSDLWGWPSLGPENPIALTTVVVDSHTGIVLAFRVDAWTVEFSNAVRVAIAEQLVHDFDDNAAAAQQRTLYEAYESPELLVAGKAVATCQSEAPEYGGVNGVTIHRY